MSYPIDSVNRSFLVATIFIAGCSSTPATDTNTPAAGATDTASAGVSPGATASPGSSGTAQANATSAPVASATPVAPAGPTEAVKDPNALVLDISVEASKGALADADATKMKAALVEKIAGSNKVGVPTSKGITGTRKVATRLIVDPVAFADKKMTEKVQLNGVTADGHCPLFDLNAKATLEGGSKDNPADLDAVRVAAIGMVYDKLEATAATLKPNGACSSEKKKP